MTSITIFVAILCFVMLLFLMSLRMPVAFAMALVGFLAFCYLVSTGAGLSLTAREIWATFSSAELTALPMFVLMGAIAFYSGISEKLFDVANKFLVQLRGGLAIATIIACAGFAAICGSTNASSAAMGKVTLPEMAKYKYAPSLASGCVASGGTLGILIPPSAIFIIYGILTEESIGKLFAAGIIPGIILTVLFVITIDILCRLKPDLAPRTPKASWKERLASLPGLGEPLVLFGIIMGGMFFGFFTPTEAGAIGAGGIILISLVRRKLTWQAFIASLANTTKITCMIYVLVSGAVIFGRAMSVTRIPFELSEWVGGLPLPPMVIMGLILLGYLIGGCFMDSLAMVTLTVPILLPVVLKMGYDPIWFGVIIVLVTELGVITPPVGINVYVIKGVAPQIPLETIFRGIMPFIIPIVITALIIIIFPSVALFLPSLL
jgi:C4-dicarboxylate transporter, DctM subunit